MRENILLDSLRRSWSAESSSRWSEGNPARGQCGVTALVVHDRLGGEILKTSVQGQWHYYNRSGGERLDFTAEQFASPVRYDDVPSSREEAFSDTSDRQYQALSRRLAAVEAVEKV